MVCTTRVRANNLGVFYRITASLRRHHFLIAGGAPAPSPPADAHVSTAPHDKPDKITALRYVMFKYTDINSIGKLTDGLS